MSARSDLALVLILALALAGAAWRLRPAAPVATTGLLLLDPADPRLEAVVVGDVLTVEDLARIALDAPLEPAEELAPLVARARADRQALLETEEELREAEAALDAAAREVLEQLDPAQRRWILEQRDRVSVGEVEEAYWAELARRLEQGP